MASKFEKAFASARKGGAKEFKFGGKSYNTKLKSEAPAKKKSGVKLPKTGPAMGSRSDAVKSMAKSRPSFSGLSDVASSSNKATGLPKKMMSSKKSFMKDTETLNNFRQKESRRASDEATGAKNAPKVKRAIGKFMLGKGYKG